MWEHGLYNIGRHVVDPNNDVSIMGAVEIRKRRGFHPLEWLKQGTYRNPLDPTAHVNPDHTTHTRPGRMKQQMLVKSILGMGFQLAT